MTDYKYKNLFPSDSTLLRHRNDLKLKYIITKSGSNTERNDSTEDKE